MSLSGEILFRETQRFKQWWLWLFLLSFNALSLLAVIMQRVFGKVILDDPDGDGFLIILFLITLLITLLTTSIRLDTEVKRTGIYVRLFPFHRKYRHYPWSDINKIYTRKYSPLREYGGWGIRYSITGKGRAYNISGVHGLQIEFTNNKKLLIGTNNPEELNVVLIQLGVNGS